ncbi:MAG: cupredoxin domain-containing protein [Candidatus Caldarchaeum sp.]
MSTRFLLLLGLAAAAAATAYVMYAMTMEPSTAGEERITVYMGEYHYTPNEVHVKRNVRTLIFFVNGGAYPHNAYLKEESRDLVPVLYPGNSTSVELVFGRAGVYSILCTVAYPAPVSHYELGMVAKLVVR